MRTFAKTMVVVRFAIAGAALALVVVMITVALIPDPGQKPPMKPSPGHSTTLHVRYFSEAGGMRTAVITLGEARCSFLEGGEVMVIEAASSDVDDAFRATAKDGVVLSVSVKNDEIEFDASDAAEIGRNGIRFSGNKARASEVDEGAVGDVIASGATISGTVRCEPGERR
jgi:hypothetical protein